LLSKKDYLLGPECVDCGLDRPWRALPQPLFGQLLVWGMWKDTIDLSTVAIRSNVTMEWRQAIAKKASQILTLSFFISW
jgi:hypothetical protein